MPNVGRAIAWWPTPSRNGRRVRHVIATLIWAYIILQLFVLDLDHLLKQLLPRYLGWAVDYKLLMALAICAILLVAVRWTNIVAWSIYIFFYPLTRLCIGLLYTSLVVIKMRSWAVLFSILNLVFSFFATWKYSFVLGVVSLIAATTILTSDVSFFIAIAVIAMIIVIGILILWRFVSLFRPTRLFQIYTKIMAWLIVNGQKAFTPDPTVRGLDPTQMNQSQLDKWSANLQAAVIYSEVCGFLQIKFKGYRNSGTAVAYYLLSFFALLATVVVLLSFINYGLYRIQPKSFLITDGHSLFDFVYYSFASMFFQRIPEINPIAPIAKVMWMAETFMALVFGSMLLSLFFAVKRNMDDAIVAQAIADLQQQRATVGSLVQSQFSLSLDEAIAKLESVKKSVSTLINALRAASGQAPG